MLLIYARLFVGYTFKISDGFMSHGSFLNMKRILLNKFPDLKQAYGRPTSSKRTQASGNQEEIYEYRKEIFEGVKSHNPKLLEPERFPEWQVTLTNRDESMLSGDGEKADKKRKVLFSKSKLVPGSPPRYEANYSSGLSGTSILLTSLDGFYYPGYLRDHMCECGC